MELISDIIVSYIYALRRYSKIFFLRHEIDSISDFKLGYDFYKFISE